MTGKMKRTALVLGATGGIGGAMVKVLMARGWHVRALSRNIAKAAVTAPAVEWRQGDALNAGDVVQAASGVDLIVHAVNPPGYRNWETLVLPMLDSTIKAAKSHGATILLPGTIYNFGPDTFPLLTETSPQNPVTKKGAIRAEMERRLEAVSRDGVRVIVLRAGDFFGPGAANNWFSQGLIKPGKPVTSVINPGRKGLGHQWAYLPDVAETMMRLVEQGETLPAFAAYHFQGLWDADGTRMIEAIRRVTRNPRLKVWSFPWWLMPLAAPFAPLLKELYEMRYLWQQPLRMPNNRLVATIGSEPSTPIDDAVRATLVGLGCLRGEEPNPSASLALANSNRR
ncbi:NAD(P)H-binding protein [Pararhizobium arenae]|uniref:NAD(P)H-binding protein n=1 Tax=Pararhizobium arenae TaxID=1856850 RepID=UPI00094B00C0|nr:NAD(P)H-binding protein [Pararhizobium arenae]